MALILLCITLYWFDFDVFSSQLVLLEGEDVQSIPAKHKLDCIM